MQEYKDTYLENQVYQIARLQTEGKFIAADEHLTGFGLALAYPLAGLLAGRPPSGWIIILIQIPQIGDYEDGIMVVVGVYALDRWLLRGRVAKSSL